MTAARLRIPNITDEELDTRLTTVMADLGLSHRAHTMVGGGEIVSLSGGERRRVSIGQELVSSQNPVLCCDEPTTGLDSSTAESVVKLLHDLAHTKKSLVIATIHQPNSNITALFDDFMLLSKGRCVYFGPFSNAVERFSSLGHTCPLYCNPTDFFIRLVMDENIAKTLADDNDARLEAEIANTLTKYEGDNSAERQAASSNQMNRWRRYPTSRALQTSILVQRSLKQWIRDPSMLISELIQYIFIALFIGGMYYQIDSSLIDGVYNRTASLFFLLAILIFTPPFTAITIFATERSLLNKERQDNMYGASSWLLAKTLVVSPIEGGLCLSFSAITYFIIGFQPTAEKFFIFFGILLLFQLIAESLGLFFAMLTPSPTFAVVWMSLILIVALSLTGFLTASMPEWYVWIQDSNIMRFALLALLINEFEGMTFTDTASGAKVVGLDALPPSLQPSLSIGEYCAIMIGFLLGLRIMIYFVMVFKQPPALCKKTGTNQNKSVAEKEKLIELTV